VRIKHAAKRIVSFFIIVTAPSMFLDHLTVNILILIFSQLPIYRRKEVRFKLESIDEIRSIWKIHDFLSKKRKETDLKYDYRYSVLISVFGRLLADGYLEIDDLSGLKEDKLEKIKSFETLYQKH
jgi:hypothetical protein